MLKIKRVYETASPEDGFRILVDRLWPRAVSKDQARIDEWRRDLAPSDDLRNWYGHDPAKWDEFCRCYKTELEDAGKMDDLRAIGERAKTEDVTLVFAAADAERSNAAFLHALILELG